MHTREKKKGLEPHLRGENGYGRRMIQLGGFFQQPQRTKRTKPKQNKNKSTKAHIEGKR
jgi:hypothetical protein